MADEKVEIGVVHSVNPARREIRVTPMSAYAHEFERLDWVDLRLPGGEEKRCRVASVNARGPEPVLTLVAGVPKDSVAVMRGAQVFLLRDELKGPKEGHFYLDELMGIDVATRSGDIVGRVCEVFETAANDVAEIERPDGSRFMLAVVPDAVHVFERGARLVLTDDFEPFAVEQETKDGGKHA
jgi:16S rRNA processing protein RimM